MSSKYYQLTSLVIIYLKTNKVTLHEAIEKVIKQKGCAMTTTEIAAELNVNKWYQKKDKTPITAYQIHGRTKNYSQLFNRDGTTVSLITMDNLK